MDPKINTTEIGKTVDKTTNYLKKLSDYIEEKLYDTDGNIKNGGVKSLSLTFAMLVGFSMAIITLSSIFITFILFTKSTTISEKEKEIEKIEKKLITEEINGSYWEKRYSNVYSQCDSIGYERARQAFNFSNTINKEIISQKNKINTSVEQNSTELKNLKQFNNEIKTIQNKIN